MTNVEEINLSFITFTTFVTVKNLFLLDNYWNNHLTNINNFDKFSFFGRHVNYVFIHNAINIIKLLLNDINFVVKSNNIFHAIKHNSIGIIKYINLNFPSQHIKNCAFLDSIRFGNLELVKYFYKNNSCFKICVLNNRENIIVSSIVYASFFGYLDIVHFLYNTNVFNINDYCESLKMATKSGNLNIIQYFKDQNIDVYFNNSKLLEIASENNHLEIVKWLHKNRKYEINNKSLQLASKNGCYEIVCYLCENGFDIHYNNDSAFRSAARHGHFKVVRCLHQYGVNIQIVGNSAMVDAYLRNHKKVIKYLQDNGISISFGQHVFLCKTFKN